MASSIKKKKKTTKTDSLQQGSPISFSRGPNLVKHAMPRAEMSFHFSNSPFLGANLALIIITVLAIMQEG